MRKILDTRTTDDPNVFGEVIREQAFVGEGIGGYSTQQPQYPFRFIHDNDPRYRTMLELLDPDLLEGVRVIASSTCCIGWFNDGDTTMVIKEDNRVAENPDAKKTDNWRWLNE